MGVFAAGSQTVNTSVRVGFSTGASGTALPATSSAASGSIGMIIDASAMPPGGGYVRGNGGGIVAIGGIAQQISVTTSLTTGGRVKIVGSYFLILEG
jgi:hypothetical protein